MVWFLLYYQHKSRDFFARWDQIWCAVADRVVSKKEWIESYTYQWWNYFKGFLFCICRDGPNLCQKTKDYLALYMPVHSSRMVVTWFYDYNLKNTWDLRYLYCQITQLKMTSNRGSSRWMTYSRLNMYSKAICEIFSLYLWPCVTPKSRIRLRHCRTSWSWTRN